MDFLQKNCIKIGLVWPQQLHFWSTGAYRGSPPYAIFPLPDTKKYSIVLCYVLPLPMLNILSKSLWTLNIDAISNMLEPRVNPEVQHWILRRPLQWWDYSLNAARRSLWGQTMRNTLNHSGQIQQKILEKYCKKSWGWAPLVQWWPTMQFKCSKCRNHSSSASLCPLPEPLGTASCNLGRFARSSSKPKFIILILHHHRSSSRWGNSGEPH